MAAFMNNTPEYVVSSTLDTLEWSHSHLITRDSTAKITNLKQQPGKNILIPGSPTLVRSAAA